MSHSPYADQMMLDEVSDSTFTGASQTFSSGGRPNKNRGYANSSRENSEMSMTVSNTNTIVDSQSSKSNDAHARMMGMGQYGRAAPYHNAIMDDAKMKDIVMKPAGATGAGGRVPPSGAGNVPGSADDAKTSDQRVVGSYVLGETIGMGGYSKVKLGYHKETQEQVAIKIMFGKYGGKVDEKTKKHLIREISVMQSVSHQNVLKLIEFYDDVDYPETDGTVKQKCTVTILEYAPCGELFDYLMFTGAFGDIATRTYTHQLMDGLHAMHKKGFAHRDLKPENLLIDKYFTLKIADFGFSRSFVDSDDIIRHMMTTCGTKGYLAPEVLERKPYTYKADLFTTGIIIFTTYCAFPPFQEAVETDWWWKHLSKGITYLEKSKKYGKTDPKKAQQYTKHGIQALQQFWENHTKRLKIDQEFQELMINMLHPLPERRFNHQQIRNHKWYNGRIMTQEELTKYMNDRVQKVAKQRKKKVMQMVADKNKDIGDRNVYRAWDTLKHLLKTHIAFNFGESEYTPIMDQIDPERAFLDHIEREQDAPDAGARARVTTFSQPTEFAARLQKATDDLKNGIVGAIASAAAADTNNNGSAAAPETSPTLQPPPPNTYVLDANFAAYPHSNLSIMNCKVAGPDLIQPEDVALSFKQYIKRGTKLHMTQKDKLYLKTRKKQTAIRANQDNDIDDDVDDDDDYDDPPSVGSDVQADNMLIINALTDDEEEEDKEQNQWVVYVSKLKGSSKAFEKALEDVLSTYVVLQAIEEFEDTEED